MTTTTQNTLENLNPEAVSTWQKILNQAWKSDRRSTWNYAATIADRNAQHSDNEAETRVWIERCDWAAGRAHTAQYAN